MSSANTTTNTTGGQAQVEKLTVNTSPAPQAANGTTTAPSNAGSTDTSTSPTYTSSSLCGILPRLRNRSRSKNSPLPPELQDAKYVGNDPANQPRRVFLIRSNYVDVDLLYDYLDEIYGKDNYHLDTLNDQYSLRADRDLTYEEGRMLGVRTTIRYPDRIPTRTTDESGRPLTKKPQPGFT
ncbi:hypothetical protein MKZ38_010600 [Zalerion maritima]|uniref:Uncharacterized protein n=1 Tax=Zalerion maritima TaxID=339359 RepID=A0AAD5RSY6_9PEZI|nr:hypothetical protein MKZ38_010600 [Zalerion maritima]